MIGAAKLRQTRLDCPLAVGCGTVHKILLCLGTLTLATIVFFID